MNGGPLLACQDLTHVYLAGTPLASVALRGVTLSIYRGESVGILGPTGSGKSTLVQIFAGLLRPTGGRVWVGGVELGGRGVDRKRIRQRIGLVFQYPEHQLFEETVFEDVAFGPRNLGLGPEEVAERVEEALSLVGLAPEKFRHRSPFSLSGGEMRRVAIAGVLAMRPEVLILDEPTAGLDPQGRRALWELVRRLRGERPDLTLVLISHRM
ncbi:MAG: ATP-binding cassette domain-containing protein, partial [Armatimonadota bacterium]|nr:ATP-binding cassette domain-containing protein [Armatimonadota bacterium]